MIMDRIKIRDEHFSSERIKQNEIIAKKVMSYHKVKVQKLFDELLRELLSINPKHVDIMDLSNILNARKNTLDKLK
jgi:hypothetical protein